jgi:hypothetical protein
VNPIGKRPDLPDPVTPRNTDQDRLVVAAGEKLDLAPADEVGEVADDIGTVGLKPIEERTGEVETCLYLGMTVKTGNQRGIRPLGHILED